MFLKGRAHVDSEPLFFCSVPQAPPSCRISARGFEGLPQRHPQRSLLGARTGHRSGAEDYHTKYSKAAVVVSLRRTGAGAVDFALGCCGWWVHKK